LLLLLPLVKVLCLLKVLSLLRALLLLLQLLLLHGLQPLKLHLSLSLHLHLLQHLLCLRLRLLQHLLRVLLLLLLLRVLLLWMLLRWVLQASHLLLESRHCRCHPCVAAAATSSAKAGRSLPHSLPSRSCVHAACPHSWGRLHRLLLLGKLLLLLEMRLQSRLGASLCRLPRQAARLRLRLLLPRRNLRLHLCRTVCAWGSSSGGCRWGCIRARLSRWRNRLLLRGWLHLVQLLLHVLLLWRRQLVLLLGPGLC